MMKIRGHQLATAAGAGGVIVSTAGGSAGAGGAYRREGRAVSAQKCWRGAATPGPATWW